MDFFAILGLLSGGAVVSLSELRRRGAPRRDPVLPFLPSHVQAIEGEPDAATRFLAAVHDMTMEVIEAWNAGSARRRIGGGIQAALSRRQLEASCAAVLRQGARLREELGPYEALGEWARETLVLVGAIWRHESTVRRVHAGSREQPGRVDSADHSFFFDADRCDAAAAAVARFLLESERFDLYQPGDKQVDIERLDPTERMFLVRLVQDTVLRAPGMHVDDATLQSLTNEWLLGSRLHAQLAQVQDRLAALRAMHVEAFAQMRDTPAITQTRSAGGEAEDPPGLRASGQIRRALGGIDLAVGSLLRTLHQAELVARSLSQLARSDDPVSDEEFLRLADSAYGITFPDSTLPMGRRIARDHWWRSVALAVPVVVVVRAVGIWIGH